MLLVFFTLAAWTWEFWNLTAQKKMHSFLLLRRSHKPRASGWKKKSVLLCLLWIVKAMIFLVTLTKFAHFGAILKQLGQLRQNWMLFQEYNAILMTQRKNNVTNGFAGTIFKKTTRLRWQTFHLQPVPNTLKHYRPLFNLSQVYMTIIYFWAFYVMWNSMWCELLFLHFQWTFFYTLITISSYHLNGQYRAIILIATPTRVESFLIESLIVWSTQYSKRTFNNQNFPLAIQYRLYHYYS